MTVSVLRAVLVAIAAWEGVWSVLFYARPASALGLLGRTVLDPVIARQYPLYLASAALAYALTAVAPRRFELIGWICVVQRGVEGFVAALDWRASAISTSAFLVTLGCEAALALGLALLLRSDRTEAGAVRAAAASDRGLVRLLRIFGGLQLFWFFASTVFVQLGARLLGWKLQDPYTTQQQGIALLVIGLVSLAAASQVARYRVFVWIPVASQLIGVANAFVEIYLRTIPLSAAAVQWAIQLTIVIAFAWFSRRQLRSGARRLKLESSLADR